jgi:hypothetical protein
LSSCGGPGDREPPRRRLRLDFDGRVWWTALDREHAWTLLAEGGVVGVMTNGDRGDFLGTPHIRFRLHSAKILQNFSCPSPHRCSLPTRPRGDTAESAMPMSSGEQSSETESPYAQQWQAGARELRMQAQQMSSPEAKSLMLGVADDYDHLTQIAEAMALIRSVLASAIEHDASETG